MKNMQTLHPSAIHIDGGDAFDDLRIDLASSWKAQEQWLEACKLSTKRPRNWLPEFKYLTDGILYRSGLLSKLVDSGLIRAWLQEFNEFWTKVLGGRPLKFVDFFPLLFNYRTKFHSSEILSWESDLDHLRNWSHYKNVYSILHFSYKQSVAPIRSRQFRRLISKASRVLEFGCGSAPIYRMSLQYCRSKKRRWTLADVPSFSYFWARYRYGTNDDLECKTIDDGHLNGETLFKENEFDLIFCQEVLEHTPNPLTVVENLMKALEPGGLFVFDFVVTESKGLDSLGGMKFREETLQYIQNSCRIIYGKIDLNMDTRLTVAEKL